MSTLQPPNPLFEAAFPPGSGDEKKPMSFQQFALNGVEVLFDHNVHDNSLEGGDLETKQSEVAKNQRKRRLKNGGGGLGRKRRKNHNRISAESITMIPIPLGYLGKIR